MDLTNITTENKTPGGILSNYYYTCKKLINQEHPKARIKRIINIFNPWGENPGFFVEHVLSNYKVHYVLEEDGKIIDPFLLKEGLIPKEDYLQRYYKNSQALKIV